MVNQACSNFNASRSAIRVTAKPYLRNMLHRVFLSGSTSVIQQTSS